MKSDQHTVSNTDEIFKYFNDATLQLDPENTDVRLEQEIQHILSWAANNDLIINDIKNQRVIVQNLPVQTQC
jgi:predicted phosphatase